MSTSFTIANGDLVIDAGRAFGVVSGQNKLLQDLRLWVLEKLGLDPSNPTFGNTLDGAANETHYSGFIGVINTTHAQQEIRNIIIDLLQRYQSMQFEKIRSETIRYLGANTLAEDEILQSINKVEVIDLITMILVQVNLVTLAGSTIKLTIPISTQV